MIHTNSRTTHPGIPNFRNFLVSGSSSKIFSYGASSSFRFSPSTIDESDFYDSGSFTFLSLFLGRFATYLTRLGLTVALIFVFKGFSCYLFELLDFVSEDPFEKYGVSPFSI